MSNNKCRRRLLPVLLLAALLFSPILRPAAASTITLTARDNGRALTLDRGDILVVSLRSTPGTGFGWAVAHLDPAVLSQLGTPELVPSAHPVPGAPATQVLRFTAISRGSTTVELDYVRPWEHGVPPAHSFRVTVKVR
jgi:inhibitor of cysteine peptidase